MDCFTSSMSQGSFLFSCMILSVHDLSLNFEYELWINSLAGNAIFITIVAKSARIIYSYINVLKHKRTCIVCQERSF